ncbi:hypothetical protein ANN_01147 [Periplaneta americana]|uniref:Uncharacterized protein n=1 Tax=Periplaneta americana TaxID=6978 RepID=A0ABQ8TSS1_PERAM|nr:hypothetical protein ANN_01147 [Periplaneta americana]
MNYRDDVLRTQEQYKWRSGLQGSTGLGRVIGKGGQGVVPTTPSHSSEEEEEEEKKKKKKKRGSAIASRAVASWSKASYLGLTLRNARWFDSS